LKCHSIPGLPAYIPRLCGEAVAIDRRHSDFEEALANHGITETTVGRGGFVKLDFGEAL
jgi:hypothetical protein